MDQTTHPQELTWEPPQEPSAQTLPEPATAPIPAASTPAPPAVAPVPVPSSTAPVSLPAPVSKPKSKGPPPRSPSPVLPPPPPPRVTVRLDIKLGGPQNYEVDILGLSKETGQRPPTPPRTQISDRESDGEAEPVASKRGRKSAAQEYYDLDDPFIDDSELAVDERKFFAQTKQKGFYVSSGEVALLKDKTTKSKAPLSKSHISPAKKPLSTVHLAPGNRDSPIRIGSDMEDDSKSGEKRKASEENGVDGKRRKRNTELEPFDPQLEKMFQEMKDLISQETWENKGKFPPNLKPPLKELAMKALILGEYDDNFFSMMPRLFPYNKFTMTKLIKRLVYEDHYKLLQQRQDELLAQLGRIAMEGFDKAKEEWERSYMLWEKRVQRAKEVAAEQAPADATAPPSRAGSASAAPPPSQAPADDAMDVDGEHAGADTPASGAVPAKDTHPPPKKYRMTETIRQILWDLVLLSNESVKITNDKNTLENSSEIVSEQGVRKVLYQRIVAAFPEGWVTSGHISREVSAMKKKYEKDEEE
ncbi:hypothetical protein SISSUDRAFT_1065056 [Sistotremastrum suecicum HHB10207 ss-3]|uniref:Ubinuclein middle domain-containing protein n=1 Tax=Sistotremastrum suecicum HHB10207 ss-3 TaxID=1314776 RepID=A0A165ZXQ7_9AGAM|nr:hypothetical protein SISSUDRAFT_1065056 [Sistotremastrum suecicum HHB10207 ss-3]